MTSMYDEPGRLPALPDPTSSNGKAYWPGADRRRNELPAHAVLSTPREREYDPASEGFPSGRPLSTASRAATAFDATQLGTADRVILLNLVMGFGLNPDATSPRFFVGRTRRGYLIMLTTFELDDDGMPVHVLGHPVTRHHLQPVGQAELPVACREVPRA